MTDLITRLEQAETGSRELSDEVLLSLGYELKPAHELSSTMVWYHPGGRVQLLSERPDPTRSVDDTKLLQPDGYAIRLSVNSKMTDVEIYNKDWMGECSAKTEENARCIAILKAHEHG